jgi:hypothetical protein
MAIVYNLKVMFISWVIGHASTLLLNRMISNNKLLKLNFVRSEKVNKLIGVGIYKWVLTNSFVRYFNPRLQITVKKPNLSELLEIRAAMTYAETVHLIGFSYIIARIIMNIINKEHQMMIVPLIAVNITVNFYPVLVQQLNKRRIERLIMVLEKRSGNMEISSVSLRQQ